MSQSRGKIAVFFKEFPFLEKVISSRGVKDVQVERLSPDIATESPLRSYGPNAHYYLFNKEGDLLGKTRTIFGETIEGAMKRIVPEKVKYVVGTWKGLFYYISYIFGLASAYIVVYKMPKEGNLMELIEQERVKCLQREAEYLTQEENRAREEIQKFED